MTFCYLAAFNWWLLLCPWPLSHDWQMGSVPLVTSGWDPRNFLTGAAMIALLALVTRCILDLEVKIQTWFDWAFHCFINGMKGGFRIIFSEKCQIANFLLSYMREYMVANSSFALSFHYFIKLNTLV